MVPLCLLWRCVLQYIKLAIVAHQDKRVNLMVESIKADLASILRAETSSDKLYSTNVVKQGGLCYSQAWTQPNEFFSFIEIEFGR